MNGPNTLVHARDVQFAVSRAQRSRDPMDMVTRSWSRCLNEYDLDPVAPADPVEVSARDLKHRIDRLGSLFTAARAEFDWLYRQISDPQLAVVLVDPDGVVLHVAGGRDFLSSAGRQGLRTGAQWNERQQGTNGMGTCLAERRPVTIARDQHFFSLHTNLVCDASPIYDGRGNIAAVIDVSAVGAERSASSLALVAQTAASIESRALLVDHAQHFVLRFHTAPEIVLSLREGLLGVSAEGKVMAANREAVALLGARTVGELLGRELGELVDTRFADLASAARRAPYTPSALVTRDGRKLFGLLQGAGRPPMIAAAPPSLPHGAALSAHRGRIEKIERLSLGDRRVQASVNLALKVIEQGVPILISGETGTGKEWFARALHGVSRRYLNPFVAVNCAAIPENLIEAELFGYRAGAFTGATREGRRGRIMQANGGILFLDEVGDTPLPLQARLLRVLEEGTVAPLGGDQAEKIDLQVISATHRDLPQMVARGEFRDDLYYRLQGVEIRLPPLRERADRSALIDRILEEESRGEAELDPSARDALMTHRWPGNLRQLRHALRVAVAVADGGVIMPADLPAEVREPGPPMQFARASEAGEPTDERGRLIADLERHRWNVAALARTLHVSRNTLYRRMKRLGIEVGPPD